MCAVGERRYLHAPLTVRKHGGIGHDPPRYRWGQIRRAVKLHSSRRLGPRQDSDASRAGKAQWRIGEDRDGERLRIGHLRRTIVRDSQRDVARTEGLRIRGRPREGSRSEMNRRSGRRTRIERIRERLSCIRVRRAGGEREETVSRRNLIRDKAQYRRIVVLMWR